MKKYLLIALAVMFTAITVSAQDLGEATNTAQAANEALTSGNYAEALKGFEAALEMADLCGGEGLELAETCKGVIPTIMLAISKDYIKESKYDDAVSYLSKTVVRAEELESIGVVEEAKALIPQVYLQQGNKLLKAKQTAAAATAFTKSLELDPTNGTTALLLGRALEGTDAVKAEEAYLKAIENGQEDNAKKRLSNMFLRQAQNALRANKLNEVIDFARKSNEYVPNANAFKLAAGAAIKAKKTTEAIGYYEQYLELAPDAKDAADINYTIGALAHQSGNIAKAKTYYSKVLNHPKYGPAVKPIIDKL